MANAEYMQNYKELESRHKINRWLDLSVGIAVIYLSFLGMITEPVSVIGQIPLYLILAMVGGKISGSAIRNWKGSKELKLAFDLLNQKSDTDEHAKTAYQAGQE